MNQGAQQVNEKFLICSLLLELGKRGYAIVVVRGAEVLGDEHPGGLRLFCFATAGSLVRGLGVGRGGSPCAGRTDSLGAQGPRERSLAQVQGARA